MDKFLGKEPPIWKIKITVTDFLGFPFPKRQVPRASYPMRRVSELRGFLLQVNFEAFIPQETCSEGISPPGHVLRLQSFRLKRPLLTSKS